MEITPQLLTGHTESNPPSDEYEQLENLLRAFTSPQKWTDFSEWNAQLLNHQTEVNNYRNLLRTLRDPERIKEIGWRRSMMRRYGKKWPHIEHIRKLIRKEQASGRALKKSLGEFEADTNRCTYS